MNEKNTLYIVIPCYKEQEVLPETSKRLREKMHQLMDEGKISRQSRVMFVNDGSSDNTWPIKSISSPVSMMLSVLDIGTRRASLILASSSSMTRRACPMLSPALELPYS